MPEYIVITPARDEERFLPQLIASVVAEKHVPKRWTIIDDCSTDATAGIIDAAAVRNSWIKPVHLGSRRGKANQSRAHHPGNSRAASNYSFACNCLLLSRGRHGLEPCREGVWRESATVGVQQSRKTRRRLGAKQHSAIACTWR